jgi:Predicted oxidoreductase
MRLASLGEGELDRFIHGAMEIGASFFDHADIYGDGACEELFGRALKGDPSLDRGKMIIQSKCGIRKGFYDQSKEHILSSVEGSLRRLGTDYLDLLLIHRPDALVEPEEVAAAFDELESSGKVLRFGVSNHKPMQIELLRRFVKQELVVNQLQFSLPASSLVASGMEANMETEGALDRDGGALDYCRLRGITIQAWSPFQRPGWKGPFIGSAAYEALNEELSRLAREYGASETAIAAAWILRHPAKMQLVAGTTSIDRLREIAGARDIALSREHWYRLYLAAGHTLP